MNRQQEADAHPDHPWNAQQHMVDSQLARRGIASQRVLEACRRVPRRAFVPPDVEDQALEDGPLSIGHGQTISQPYVVALMAELLQLKPGERALEIGTGSGYSAAVLAELASEVVTVERIEALAESARARLRTLGYGQVHVHCGDGTRGWPEDAPYDAISVTAATSEVPPALIEQLGPGGRLVAPLGSRSAQVLTLLERGPDGELRPQPILPVRFVPLLERVS